MLLALDIGNTNVKVGVFEGQTLRSSWRLSSDARRQPAEYESFLHSLLSIRGIKPSQITGVVLCSGVPPLTTVFEELSHTVFNQTPLIISAGVKTGVRVMYENPRDVGPDRVADAAAAFHLYGGPVIVVDFGTGLTFNAVTREGDYLGGAIAPGLSVAAESLFANASMLRRVELVRPKSVVGRNTVASLQSGLVFGYVSMVEGMVKRIREEIGQDAKAIATGGQAGVIAKETTVFHAVHPDLTLVGLRIIYEMNR
ncbi:MAG: type III pantothenate kinase [Dehalococcoidia bacterium]|nr:type III pantothenate kinase [Dehalococcoidia bacterium]